MPPITFREATGPDALRRGLIHVLRPGTWPAHPRDITLSEADLAAIAAAYDPEAYQAPVVVGHPVTDSPSYGWALGLRLAEDGLWAEVDVTPSLAEIVEAGHYRSVSVSLWPPGSPGNPRPEGWSLKHIGFLGATPPAVKGLKPLRLADACESITVELMEREMSNQDKGAADAAAREAELVQKAATLAEREQRVAAAELELKRASWRAKVQVHVQAGRVLPTEAPGLVALMERLDNQAVTLAEAEQPALNVLEGFLERLPARVDLGERAPGTGNGVVAAPFQAPAGYTLAENSARVHAAAIAWQAKNPGVDFVAAVRAVTAN